MQDGQYLSVATLQGVVEPFWIVEGKDVGEDGRGREGQCQPEVAHCFQPALPYEVDRQQREHEQAGVAEIERRHIRIRVEPNAE